MRSSNEDDYQYVHVDRCTDEELRNLIGLILGVGGHQPNSAKNTSHHVTEERGARLSEDSGRANMQCNGKEVNLLCFAINIMTVASFALA